MSIDLLNFLRIFGTMVWKSFLFLRMSPRYFLACRSIRTTDPGELQGHFSKIRWKVAQIISHAEHWKNFLHAQINVRYSSNVNLWVWQFFFSDTAVVAVSHNHLGSRISEITKNILEILKKWTWVFRFQKPRSEFYRSQIDKKVGFFQISIISRLAGRLRPK